MTQEQVVVGLYLMFTALDIGRTVLAVHLTDWRLR